MKQKTSVLPMNSGICSALFFSPRLVSFLPTVDRYGSILTKLLFCFMHLADEVDEAFPWFWHSLFWPVCELELPDGPWLSVLKAERETDENKRAAVALWRVTPSHYIHIYRRRACQTDDEYMTHPKRVWEAQETTIIKKRHVDTELMPQCQRDILLFKSLGFISKKSMLLFIKDALNWRKATVNTSIMLIQINVVLLNFLFICASWKIKCIAVSTEILCSTTVFNIDNNQKYFLSSKLAYYYDFWRSCDTEDCSNDAENTALITEINDSLTDIHTENSCFKL